MTSRDPTLWMWSEACRLLDRAEQLQRRFFAPASAAQSAVWEPPVDLYETEHGLLLEIALPGVAAEEVQLAVEADAIWVIGQRRLPQTSEPTIIRRLELPYGRFERRIPLPRGRYRIGRRELTHGCLLLTLEKIR